VTCHICILHLLHLFNDLLSRTTCVSWYQKGKTSPDLNQARNDGVLGCSGISWTICKQSVPCCRRIPHQHLITQFLQARCSSWHPTNSVKALNASYVYYIHTHTRLMALCLGLPGWACTRKVKPMWILLKQETVSSSGISWATCKSAPRSRQTTTPAPHHFVFTSQMPFLPPNQQCQSTEGISTEGIYIYMYITYQHKNTTHFRNSSRSKAL